MSTQIQINVLTEDWSRKSWNFFEGNPHFGHLKNLINLKNSHLLIPYNTQVLFLISFYYYRIGDVCQKL